MLFRLALAAFMGLSACSDDGSKDTISNPGGDGAAAELRQSATLPGSYANRIRIVGDAWEANGPGQEITLVFELAGISGIRQFDMTVRVEPASAFDLSSAVFTPPASDLLTPLPNGVQPGDGQVRVVWAMVDRTEPLPPTHGAGTLTLRTSSSFNAFTQARLVVSALSIGPSATLRDSYTEDNLHLGIALR